MPGRARIGRYTCVHVLVDEAGGSVADQVAEECGRHRPDPGRARCAPASAVLGILVPGGWSSGCPVGGIPVPGVLRYRGRSRRAVRIWAARRPPNWLVQPVGPTRLEPIRNGNSAPQHTFRMGHPPKHNDRTPPASGITGISAEVGGRVEENRCGIVQALRCRDQ